jgi:hypothetical protein
MRRSLVAVVALAVIAPLAAVDGVHGNKKPAAASVRRPRAPSRKRPPVARPAVRARPFRSVSPRPAARRTCRSAPRSASRSPAARSPPSRSRTRKARPSRASCATTARPGCRASPEDQAAVRGHGHRHRTRGPPRPRPPPSPRWARRPQDRHGALPVRRPHVRGRDAGGGEFNPGIKKADRAAVQKRMFVADRPAAARHLVVDLERHPGLLPRPGVLEAGHQADRADRGRRPADRRRALRRPGPLGDREDRPQLRDEGRQRDQEDDRHRRTARRSGRCR